MHTGTRVGCTWGGASFTPLSVLHQKELFEPTAMVCAAPSHPAQLTARAGF